jgi:2-polyprenyl-3-methyl-5-hydroxy-6-metoxy-1,4-benzoquinol methylase
MPYADTANQGDNVTGSAHSYNSNAEFWVQIIREGRDRYRTGLTNPAVLNAIGDAHGLAILDAGCGEGYMSRTLAKHGAKVTGIDSSAELIRAAKAHKLSAELSTSFEIGTVEALPYDPGTFDLVLCNHLLNDLEDPSVAIREFARVLTANGRIVILMLHPCFYNKHAERDEPGNNLRTSSYFQTRSISQSFVVDGLKSPTHNTTWLHPLEFYTEALRKSGFVITSLTEPHPTEQLADDDDWWHRSFTRPLFMLVVAQLQPSFK